MIQLILFLHIAFDILGSYSPNELYQALLVDAKNIEVAENILETAHHDQRVTSDQFKDLHEIYILNYVD